MNAENLVMCDAYLKDCFPIEAKSTGNELPRFYNALEFAKTILSVFNFQTRLPILFPSTSARNRLLTMDILF